MELYKTILVIWTEYPTDEVGLEDLGHAATSGDAYCVSQDCTLIPDVANDPHWDGTEFFGEDDEDDRHQHDHPYPRIVLFVRFVMIAPQCPEEQ